LIYVDDYGGGFVGCAAAVDEFRAAHNVQCPLLRASQPESGLDKPGAEVKWEAAWWVKPAC
jgi:hypothetical protein